MGKTKVFLQHGAFDTLEYLRGQKLDSSASEIQVYYRFFFQEIIMRNTKQNSFNMLQRSSIIVSSQ